MVRPARNRATAVTSFALVDTVVVHRTGADEALPAGADVDAAALDREAAGPAFGAVLGFFASFAGLPAPVWRGVVVEAACEGAAETALPAVTEAAAGAAGTIALALAAGCGELADIRA